MEKEQEEEKDIKMRKTCSAAVGPVGGAIFLLSDELPVHVCPLPLSTKETYTRSGLAMHTSGPKPFGLYPPTSHQHTQALSPMSIEPKVKEGRHSLLKAACRGQGDVLIGGVEWGGWGLVLLHHLVV